LTFKLPISTSKLDDSPHETYCIAQSNDPRGLSHLPLFDLPTQPHRPIASSQLKHQHLHLGMRVKNKNNIQH